MSWIGYLDNHPTPSLVVETGEGVGVRRAVAHRAAVPAGEAGR